MPEAIGKRFFFRIFAKHRKETDPNFPISPMFYPIKLKMKCYAVLCCLLCSLTIQGRQSVSTEDSFGQLLKELDLRLSRTSLYEQQHLKEIQATRTSLAAAHTPQEKLLQTRVLVEQFLFYQSDSCLHHVNQAILLAKAQKDRKAENQMWCRKAVVYALCGLPWEGEALLDSLLSTPLDSSMRSEVYKASIDLLEQAQASNLPNELLTRNYRQMEAMEDSVTRYDRDPNSRLLRLRYRSNSEQEIIERLRRSLQQTDNKTAKGAYAMIIANKCQQQNALEERNRNWALAAIYDVEAHKMISTALIRLAALMVEQKDWERASRYAEHAYRRTAFYQARLQAYELAPILEQCMLHEKQLRKKTFLLYGSLTAALLLAAVFLFIRNRKKSRKEKALLQELGEEKELRKEAERKEQLQKGAIKTLSEGLMHFLSISIDSIYELGSMRHTVRNKIRSKEIEQLAALFKGDTNLARNQKNLLHRFDIAFNRLYPDFQNQVNALLKEDCKIETSENELLNNELRLLALMKLGITDSSRIATILDISVNTVYFYRNRLKNKAINRDSFEEGIMQIAL